MKGCGPGFGVRYNLGFNIFMDASMFTGVGEEARVAELAVKEGADLGEHLLEDSAEHAAEACGLSFAATTLVASASGEVAISSLHVGDQVWAYNASTHTMELEPVQHVWINHDNDLLDLTIQPQTKVPEAAQKDTKAETIHTTRKHPFLTAERGFLPANALTPGMHVIEANGHIGVITKWVVVPGQATMYNLTVAHDHTYAVGVGQWVVHNANCGVTDLWRGGNASSAKLDNVRPRDIPVDENGMVYPNTGGISVNANKSGLLPGMKPWKVDTSTIPEDLQVRQQGDDPGHYLIEPARSMPLDEYKGNLRQIVATKDF